jgi:hypothetical protein
LASSNKIRFVRWLGDETCRLKKTASDTPCGACKTRARLLILGKRLFWLRWPKLGKDLLSERPMPETVAIGQFLGWIAAIDYLSVPLAGAIG